MQRVLAPSRRTSTAIYLSAQKLVAGIAVSVYPLLLIWALRDVISPAWSYMGFFYTPPENAAASLIALLVAALPGWLMPVSGIRPSTIVIWILYILAYVPAQVVPLYASGREISSYLPFQIALLFGIVILILFGSLPVFTIPKIRFNERLFWTALFAFSCLLYAGVIARYGLPAKLPRLDEVYDVRSTFSMHSADQGALLAYGMSWQAKVISPLFIAYGILKRRPLFLAFGFGGQLLLFALAGHKSVLFSALLVFGILFVQQRGGSWAGALLPLGASCLVLGSVLIDKLAQSSWTTSLFVRRLVLVPGLLTGYYQEFFLGKEKTYSFGPFLRWAFEAPYDISVPNIIGLHYFNNVQMSANANMWADGFASFGHLGVVLVSVALGVILWTFNSLATGRDIRIATVLAGVVSFSLVNSSLMTSIGTHGIGFAVAILAVLPADSHQKTIAARSGRLPAFRRKADK